MLGVGPGTRGPVAVEAAAASQGLGLGQRRLIEPFEPATAPLGFAAGSLPGAPGAPVVGLLGTVRVE